MRSYSEQTAGDSPQAGAGRVQRRWCALAALLVWLIALAGTAFATTGQIASGPVERPAWLGDFEEASSRSRLLNTPLLVSAWHRSCPYCPAFARTLSSPEVIGQIEELVLLRLDVEADPQTSRILAIDALPTVVLLAPDGAEIARGRGYMPPGTFLQWLAAAKEAAALRDPAKLAKRTPAELAEVLASRDPVQRQAAVEVLSTRQETGASVVVETLGQGKLAAALGALEVLRLWGAPIEGVDPWKPDSIAPAMEGLRTWVQDTQRPQEVRMPSAEEIERDLNIWMTGDEGVESRAAYERLARAGSDLLPTVRSLTPPAWDRRRERLTALRYRLLLPSSTALRFPQVPFQMAARDPNLRVDALTSLSRNAGAPLEDFFLEAFTDPDPKVRETALRGLTQTGTEFAKEHVVKMLADPSPDVRATLLKELAVSPLPDVAEDLARYAFDEEDEDLIVHAVQALTSVRDEDAAFDALLKLTRHRSWRVRAEAVSGLGEVSTSGRELRRLSQKRCAAVAKALEEVLHDDDLFVVSKAVEALGDLEEADLSDCLDELAQLAQTHRDLTPIVLKLMASNDSIKERALPTIKGLCRHDDPEVRAQAVGTLLATIASPASEEVLACLSDPESSVRTATAAAVSKWAAASDESSDAAALRIPGAPRERLVSALRGLTSAGDTTERFQGLKALVALGEQEVAFPGVLEVVSSEPQYAGEAVGLMPSLKWDRRKQLYLTLSQLPLDDDTWASLFTSVFADAPESEEALLWDVFSRDIHVLASPGSVLATVVEFYGYAADLPSLAVDSGRGRRLAERAREQLKSENPRRQAMALLLLCRAQLEEGETEAMRIAGAPADGGVAEELRQAALEILLCIGCREHEELVLQTMAADQERLRIAAFESLLRAYSPLRPGLRVYIGDEIVWAEFLAGGDLLSAGVRTEASRPWEPPELPEGLSLDLVRVFVGSDDPELSAGAAYLMSVTGHAEYLSVLAEAWRRNKDEQGLWLALARGIAAADDDDSVDLLREIYNSFDAGEREYWGPELYWTTRRMSGPQAREFQKEIRNTLGRGLFR